MGILLLISVCVIMAVYGVAAESGQWILFRFYLRV